MKHEYKVGDKVRALVDFGGILNGENATVIAAWHSEPSGNSKGVDIKTSDGRISEFYSHEIEPVTETPKTWGAMTDSEKGALLLADLEWKVIQVLNDDGNWIDWKEPLWGRSIAYRIKPEPVVEVVNAIATAFPSTSVNVRITYTNGIPSGVELVE